MKLINKYQIKEEDLYTISYIELKKESSGFFEKEKLKAKSLGILKPYKVSFTELGALLSEIKSERYSEKADLIEKYGVVDINTKKSSTGMKYIIPFFAFFLIIFFFLNTSEDSSSNSNSDNIESIDGTINCLVNYDWVYPSSNSPTGAWKFSSDGTFNFSTSRMTAWGNWKVSSPGKINLNYTRTTVGTIPENKEVTMSDCNKLKVGETMYSKN
jgi:hypothetical protein